MKHPYHDILVAIAEGKEIQARQPSGWKDTGAYSVFNAMLIANPIDALQPSDYRIKPATITINGVECETPVDYPCYCVHILHPNHAAKIVNFLTIEARDAAYAALIKPFGEKA